MFGWLKDRFASPAITPVPTSSPIAPADDPVLETIPTSEAAAHGATIARIFARARAGVPLVVLAMAVSGCHVRQSVAFPAPSPGTITIAGKARVTQADRSRVYLESAVISGDSITGRQRIVGTQNSYRRLALPLTSVTAVESERVSVPKTLLAVIGSIAVASVASVAILGLGIEVF